MLLSLPTELIEHIVRLSIPPEYSSATYTERQDTLRAVCLVNRKLRDVAQPVLQEVVRVSKQKTVEATRRALLANGQRLRALGLEGEVADLFSSTYSGLRDLRLHEMKLLILLYLDILPGLERLVLKACEIMDQPVRLPHLVELTWANSWTTFEQPATFAQPELLPQLKHVAYWAEGDEEGSEPSLQLSPALLDQLDTLVVITHVAGVSSTSIHPAVLLEIPLRYNANLRLRETLARGARFYRLFACKGVRFSELADALGPITAALADTETSTFSLELLYLPSIFRPSEQHAADLSSALSTLLNLCASRKIEVDFEDTDESPGGSLTSPNFAAYVRRVREKEAKEANKQEATSAAAV